MHKKFRNLNRFDPHKGECGAFDGKLREGKADSVVEAPGD